MVGVELGVGRSLSLEPGGWGGGKLSKLWGGTNLVTVLLLSGATPEDGVVPEMWVLLPHLSAESSLFVSCWCLCRWWLDEDRVCTWRPPPTLDDSCTHKYWWTFKHAISKFQYTFEQINRISHYWENGTLKKCLLIQISSRRHKFLSFLWSLEFLHDSIYNSPSAMENAHYISIPRPTVNPV